MIGPYKLRERLGEGGMGVVWAAEQKKPLRRRVALKVIKPGMDSVQVVARFEAEREAPSVMDHPNIARVLDAGTTRGGTSLFRDGTDSRSAYHGVLRQHITDGSRIDCQLFVQVCRAVQHAHQKGIIHRDIKPSNVLVTEQDGNSDSQSDRFWSRQGIHHP